MTDRVTPNGTLVTVPGPVGVGDDLAVLLADGREEQAVGRPGPGRVDLPLAAITLDGRCQPRVALDPAVAADYAADMETGADFPPVTVYDDGATFWLADGFHRFAAATSLGRQHITCDVRPGMLRDAIAHAVGANATHGLRRTNADKRRAVETLLRDPEWSRWSDREIARRCGVSHPFVGALRSSLGTVSSEPRMYTDRHGNVGRMETGRIGHRPQPEAWPGPLTDEDWRDWHERIEPVPDGCPFASFLHRVAPVLVIMMTRAEYAGLKGSIAAVGVRKPVVVDQDGAVIDGEHRIRALTELREAGVDVPDYPVTVEVFADDGERIDRWISLNLMRQHLNRSQQAMAEAVLGAMVKEPLRDRWEGVGTAVIERAARIHRHSPPLAEMVMCGAMGLDALDGEVRTWHTERVLAASTRDIWDDAFPPRDGWEPDDDDEDDEEETDR